MKIRTELSTSNTGGWDTKEVMGFIQNKKGIKYHIKKNMDYQREKTHG